MDEGITALPPKPDLRKNNRGSPERLGALEKEVLRACTWYMNHFFWDLEKGILCYEKDEGVFVALEIKDFIWRRRQGDDKWFERYPETRSGTSLSLVVIPWLSRTFRNMERKGLIKRVFMREYGRGRPNTPEDCGYRYFYFKLTEKGEEARLKVDAMRKAGKLKKFKTQFTRQLEKTQLNDSLALRITKAVRSS